MTKNYSILNMDANSGIAMVADDNGIISAMVNGKLYDAISYRPIDGNGRQLREDSRNAINRLFNDAVLIRDARSAERAEAFEKSVAEAVEKKAVIPQKSFADALQDAFLQTLTEKASEGMAEQIYPIVEKMVTDKFGGVPIVHRFELPERKPFETSEVLHKDFDNIVNMMLSNESVYLCGPAGTGKSYLAQQVAKALELEFYYTNSVTDDVQIKGFVDANGRYHATQFYEAFTKGGIFLLDELDASVPETLVLLNNALANGYFSFPNGKAQAHNDFHCIAAGNTFGTGADNVYTGRYQLDASSMDRFALINVDYDEKIELAMADGNKELVSFARAFRNATNTVGITCLCTYRAIKRLNKFSAYMSKKDALRIGLVKGLAGDDVKLLSKNVKCNNDWYSALVELANELTSDTLPF